MKTIYTLLFLLICLSIQGQDENYLYWSVNNKKIYHTFSVGISLGGEHSLGLPKISYGLQGGLNSGVYLQLNFATALGFTLSPGIELGYRYKNIGLGYSLAYLGIPHNERFYKWTHNLNFHIRWGNFMGKIGTPFFYSHKGDEFEEYKYNFLEMGPLPINLELLYHQFEKNKK